MTGNKKRPGGILPAVCASYAGEAAQDVTPCSLEHGIVVFSFFRNILDDIPVLRDFAIFDAEDIDSSLAAVAIF